MSEWKHQLKISEPATWYTRWGRALLLSHIAASYVAAIVLTMIALLRDEVIPSFPAVLLAPLFAPILWYLSIGSFLAGDPDWGEFVDAFWPFWISYIVTALSVGWTLSRVRLFERREAMGQCAQCGYDLRATPDRCPECGQVPTPKPPGPPV
jgi:hypothetical protein